MDGLTQQRKHAPRRPVATGTGTSIGLNHVGAPPDFLAGLPQMLRRTVTGRDHIPLL